MEHFIYAPNGVMKLVEDEEYEQLLATNNWFSSPHAAKLSLEIAKKVKKEKVEVIAKPAVLISEEKE